MNPISALLKQFVHTRTLPNELCRTQYAGRVAHKLRHRRLEEFELWKARARQPEVRCRECDGVLELARLERSGEGLPSYRYTRITEQTSCAIGLEPPDDSGTSIVYALWVDGDQGFLAEGRLYSTS